MFPTDKWMKRYLEILNQDEELKLYGKYLDLTYAIETDEYTYQIEAKDGKYTLINNRLTIPKLTFRTSSNHWRNFASSTPVPTYGDLFGASAYGNIEIDGVLKDIWSNLRSLWRTVELMRDVGEVE